MTAAGSKRTVNSRRAIETADLRMVQIPGSMAFLITKHSHLISGSRGNTL